MDESQSAFDRRPKDHIIRYNNKTDQYDGLSWLQAGRHWSCRGNASQRTDGCSHVMRRCADG